MVIRCEAAARGIPLHVPHYGLTQLEVVVENETLELCALYEGHDEPEFVTVQDYRGSSNLVGIISTDEKQHLMFDGDKWNAAGLIFWAEK